MDKGLLEMSVWFHSSLKKLRREFKKLRIPAVKIDILLHTDYVLGLHQIVLNYGASVIGNEFVTDLMWWHSRKRIVLANLLANSVNSVTL